MKQQAIRRSCMVNGHKSAEINMRCTQKDCQVGQKCACTVFSYTNYTSICVYLWIILRKTSGGVKNCQHFNQIKNNKCRYSRYLINLKVNVSITLNLKKSYQAWFNKLTQNEASVQELYTLLQNGNILAFTEQQIEQYNINDDAANVFLRKRDIILEQIKALNTNLVERTEMFLKLQPENVVDDNEKIDIETESLNNNLNGYQIAGKYRFGVKFGKWTILKQNREIGGGNYNIDDNKHGEWVDVEVCSNQKYFRHTGKYDTGLRIGNWQIQNFQCQKLYDCYQVSIQRVWEKTELSFSDLRVLPIFSILFAYAHQNRQVSLFTLREFANSSMSRQQLT